MRTHLGTFAVLLIAGGVQWSMGQQQSQPGQGVAPPVVTAPPSAPHNIRAKDDKPNLNIPSPRSPRRSRHARSGDRTS